MRGVWLSRLWEADFWHGKGKGVEGVGDETYRVLMLMLMLLELGRGGEGEGVEV